LGVRAAHDFGRSAERTAIQRQAIRHYETAMYARSAIDGGILKAAGTGADPAVVAAEADVLLQQVDDELDTARGLFVEGGADEVLLATFDEMARAMNVYVGDAVALAGLLSADPAAVPAHVLTMGAAAQELQQRQLDFGARVTAATAAARADATATADSSQTRILVATTAAVLVLLFVALGMDRRIRRTSAAKSAADAINRETSARLGEQVDRQEFA
jgi:hypothetical protein